MLRIHLLGTLRLSWHDEPHRFTSLPKTLPLLAYLLLHRDRPVSRHNLAFTLWPDSDEEKARTNLRRHLYELRKALPPAPDACPWFDSDAASVWWNPQAGTWLDVDQFTALSRDPARLADAVAFYTGDLLPDCDEEWLLFERERLRTLFFDDLRRLVAHHRTAGDRPAAIAAAAQLLLHDPLAEETVRDLMTLRAEQGDPTGALLEYRRFEQRLRTELDVAPTVETSAHYDAIARQMLAATTLQPPPVVTAPTAPPAQAAATTTVAESEVPPGKPNNLPAQLTSFVGREQELAAIRAMLGRRDDPVRLLTLAGPGGSGKTRLALEVASRMLQVPGMYRDGIFYVPLAGLADPSAMPSAVASALGMVEQSDQPLAAQLAGFLRHKQMLLVLDNFEHVLEGGALLVDWLVAAPGLTVLVTSRATLRVYGEQEYPVAPLPLPDTGDLPSYEAIARNPAVELFVIRSRAVNAAFVLRPADAAVVAEICVKLDGLPLAIELAAARSKLYPPQALLARLARRLEFLENRTRLAEGRHQTLRATLDWSYQLLGAAEQRLLASLAVFARTFTLEGAESVCGEGESDVVSALTTLCDHSLVQPSQTEFGTRFTMLTTVHEYVTAMLTPAESERLQGRHAAYYAEFAQQIERELYRPQQATWQAMARTEEDNLRAALNWSLASGEPGERALPGMRIAKALARYWQIAGRLAEGRAWLMQAVALRDAAPVDLQVEVLGHAGLFAQLQGDYAAAFALHEDVLTLAHDSGNAALVAQALYSLGTAAGRSGDPARASELLAECLAIRRKLPPGAVSEADLALTLNNLAVSHMQLGDFAQVRQLLEESLALKRKSGDQVTIATALVNLGDLAFREGDLDRAEALQRESMQLRVAIDDKLGLAKSLDHMGDLAAMRGQYLRAATLFAASLAAYSEVQAKRALSTAQQVEQRIALVRAGLDPQAYAEATARGARMTLEEAVRYALARS